MILSNDSLDGSLDDSLNDSVSDLLVHLLRGLRQVVPQLFHLPALHLVADRNLGLIGDLERAVLDLPRLALARRRCGGLLRESRGGLLGEGRLITTLRFKPT